MLSLALQCFDAPGKGRGKPFVSILEMPAGIPDQSAVFTSERGFEKFIFSIVFDLHESSSKAAAKTVMIFLDMLQR